METITQINSVYINTPRVVIIEAGFITRVFCKKFSGEMMFKCRSNNGFYILDTPTKRLVFLPAGKEYCSRMAIQKPHSLCKLEILNHNLHGYWEG